LVGFKNKPENALAMGDPLNNFTVKDCQIMAVDRPKPFTFIIRGLQMTTVIERTFHVESEQDRYVAKHVGFATNGTIFLIFISGKIGCWPSNKLQTKFMKMKLPLKGPVKCLSLVMLL
jgi:hypothetical protein